MEKVRIESIVLIYSTIIATLAFLWNVIDTINKSKRRLLITYNISGFTQYKVKIRGLITSTSNFHSLENHIELEITNISNNAILIYEPPLIYTESVKYFKKSIISVNENSKSLDFKLDYPIRLESGERIVLASTDFDFKTWSNFRIKVTDSFGKTYKSGKFIRNTN